MTTTNSERIKRHRQLMRDEGFKQLSVWVHPDLIAKLQEKGHSYECYGRTLERLILKKARRRPSDLPW